MKLLLHIIWDAFFGRCYHYWVYRTIYLRPKLVNPSKYQNTPIEVYLNRVKFPHDHRWCEVCGKSQIKIGKWFPYSDSYDPQWINYTK